MILTQELFRLPVENFCFRLLEYRSSNLEEETVVKLNQFILLFRLWWEDFRNFSQKFRQRCQNCKKTCPMYFLINFSEVLFPEVILNFEREKTSVSSRKLFSSVIKKAFNESRATFWGIFFEKTPNFQKSMLEFWMRVKTILNFAWVLGKVGNTVLNLSKGTCLVFFGKAHSLWLILGL